MCVPCFSKKKRAKARFPKNSYSDFTQADPWEKQLISPIAQGCQRGHIYGRSALLRWDMDSNGSAVCTGPEGKKASQSMVQVIGSGFTLVHVLFDAMMETGLCTCWAIISQIVLRGKV
jgi:hypothetical protein